MTVTENRQKVTRWLSKTGKIPDFMDNRVTFQPIFDTVVISA